MPPPPAVPPPPPALHRWRAGRPSRPPPAGLVWRPARVALPAGGRATGRRRRGRRGRSSCCSSACQVPCTSTTSPAMRVTSGLRTCSPLRCTANTTTLLLANTIPGNTRSPMSSDRGGTTSSATPTSRSRSSSSSGWSTVVGAGASPKGECRPSTDSAGAEHHEHVAGVQRRVGPQPAPGRALDAGDRGRVGQQRRERGSCATDERRSVLDDESCHRVIDLVLLREGAGELAEVGRNRFGRAFREQAIAGEHSDRDDTRDEGDADEGELEEAEAADAGIVRSVGDDDADGCAGERQHRAGVGAERQRHHQLRRRSGPAGRR